jgi:hypothetical protein
MNAFLITQTSVFSHPIQSRNGAVPSNERDIRAASVHISNKASQPNRDAGVVSTVIVEGRLARFLLSTVVFIVLSPK